MGVNNSVMNFFEFYTFFFGGVLLRTIKKNDDDDEYMGYGDDHRAHSCW